MNKKGLLTLLAALMIAGTAFASTQEQVVTEEQAVTFEALDVDQDSAISKEEAAACEALQQGFESADANQDGKLDAAEYAAIMTPLTEEK